MKLALVQFATGRGHPEGFSISYRAFLAARIGLPVMDDWRQPFRLCELLRRGYFQ